MRIEWTNTGVYPISREQLQQNLRLPDNMDVDLLDRLLCSAIDYVEKMTNICMVSKIVTISHIGPYKFYDLKFKVSEIISVKINKVATQNYTLHNNQPSYLTIDDTIAETDVVDIEYTAEGTYYNYSANDLALAYASALYNNPEGLDELDMRRINNRLTSISG
jgi:hypothetical protein